MHAYFGERYLCRDHPKPRYKKSYALSLPTQLFLFLLLPRWT
jgi:hypothetical protein